MRKAAKYNRRAGAFSRQDVGLWRTIRESKFGGLRYNDGKSKKEDSFYVGNVRGERNGIFSDGSDDRDRRDCKTDYRDFTEKAGKSSK